MTVRPLRPAQASAASSGALPAVESVGDGVWAVPVPMPSRFPSYTLAYVLEDSGGAVHLIDPGWDLDSNLPVLSQALVGAGHVVEDVASVTVTHLHHDHLGLAHRIRSASGAVVAMHSAEQVALNRLAHDGRPVPDLEGWRVPEDVRARLADLAPPLPYPSFVADVLLEDGEVLPIPGRLLRTVHTPGHTPGHIAIVDDDNGLVFTGDLLLPQIFPGIGLGGDSFNPIGDYLRSLTRLEELGDLEVWPGHGYGFAGLGDRCAQTRAHHVKRNREVHAIMAESASPTVWDVASQVTWTDGWHGLSDIHLVSALSQTARHMEFDGPKL